jgi:hypothetical protein
MILINNESKVHFAYYFQLMYQIKNHKAKINFFIYIQAITSIFCFYNFYLLDWDFKD